MGNTRDKIGKAGLVFAGGVFRIALYVCVAVFIFWAGKTTYQSFGFQNLSDPVYVLVVAELL